MDEDDVNSASTPYTAAIAEYRVVVHDPATKTYEDKHTSMQNGNAVYDVHHPCKWVLRVFISATINGC